MALERRGLPMRPEGFPETCNIHPHIWCCLAAMLSYTPNMMKRRAYRLQLLPAALLIGALCFFTRSVPFSEKYVLPFPSSDRISKTADVPPIQPVLVADSSVEMVVASTKQENVSWLHDHLLDWRKNIYVVDDETAELTVPRNKGREAMVFLTYATLPNHLVPPLTNTDTLLTATIPFHQ